MANKIQIKRSVTTAITQSSPALSQGELAFTQNGNNFFIGAPDGTGNFRIGHVLNDGILTANQALVANSTLGIDRVITANLTAGKIWANGTLGTAGQQLFTNSTGIYWANSSFDATLQYTFTNTISFSNTVTFTQTINGTANNSLNLGGTNLGTIQGWITANASSAAANAMANVAASGYANTLQLSANLAYYTNTASMGTLVQTLTANSANNLNGLAATYYSANVNGGLVQNSSGHFVNANNGVIANSSGVFVNANTTGGLVSNSSGVFVKLDASSNTLFTNSTGLYVNTSYVSSFATNAVTVGGNSASDFRTYTDTKAATAYTNATAYADTAAANAYTWAMANTQSRNGSYSGNNTFNGSLTTFNSNVALGVGSFITSDLVPTPNNTLSLGSNNNRWKSLYISGSTIYLGNTSLSVDSSNNLVVNGLIANNLNANNATINYVTSNTTFTGANINFTGAKVNMSSANLNVGFVTAGGLSVAGDLYVAGTVTTIDATTLVVNTAQIEVASNNNVSDVIDFGMFGQYYAGGSNSYSGIARINGSTDNNPVWQIWQSKIKPGTNVTVTNQGTLAAYLKPYSGLGGFVANSSTVNITANGAIGVAIAANSLTLTTALGVTSGGTGLGSYTQGDILYASGVSTLSSLSVGTTGQVLQVSAGGLPVYAGLDGGSF
jgi:hypothetical protein